MGELVRVAPAALAPTEATRELTEMREAMQAMAGMLRTMSESMEQLRRQVRLLEKATPAQVAAINRAIRDRAVELCAIYCMPGGEKPVAAAIRKGLRVQFGITAAKDLPRCEFAVAMDAVRCWDDYAMMMEIRRRARA